MHKIYIIILALCLSITSEAQFSHQNINLLGQFNDSSVVPEPVYGIRYQACWGWVDPANNREYGIIGSTTGTYIIEVSNPTVPVERDYVPGKSSARIWHEYKTYENYLYTIADGGGNTFQISDLSYLPDSVHLLHDSTNIFESAHTLFIDGRHLYVGSVSYANHNFSAMNVYSLDDPENPLLLRELGQDYPFINHVHDMYVVHDTIFASCGNQGLYIFKYDEVSNQFVQLGSLTTYPDQGYNHSSFLSTDHTTLYMCDEVPVGMAVKVVDVTDLLAPTVVDTFYSNTGATPHNPYVIGDLLVMAYYQDGVFTYDISTPSSPVYNGYFDTHPQNPAGTYPPSPYQGCWSAFTDLPSGVLLASDMQLGLFVLDISQLTGIHQPSKSGNLSVYPNPANTEIRLKDFNTENKLSSYKLIDLSGRIVHQGDMTNKMISDFTIDARSIPSGFYFLQVQTEEKSYSQKIQIQH